MYGAYKISDDIYWVGALEWEERVIHGESMPYGSTNNAYLILDEKKVLIDTCIDSHADELIARISNLIDPTEIDILVSNHAEKDHGGSIGRILELNPDIEIVTSDPNGRKILGIYYGEEHNFHPVKTGDSINIGKRDLQFVATPMVHWPDNMVTYSPTDGILFSNDAFGQFIATSKRFDDEVDLPFVLRRATSYFANIITPYRPQTRKALDAVKEINPKMIAPSHGVVWRSHIEDIMALYEVLCDPSPEEKAVVVFSSMYGSTRRMATAITEAFMRKGVEVRLWDLDISDLSDVMTDIFSAKYLAVGCPTHNNSVLPHVGAFLSYLKGLAPKDGNRVGFAFGAYGWVKAAQDEINRVLHECKYETPLEPICLQWDDGVEPDEMIYQLFIDYLEDAGY